MHFDKYVSILLLVFIGVITQSKAAEYVTRTLNLRSSVGNTEIVSVATDGTQGNDWSSRPAVSGDGRYISFSSSAINLVSNDTNGVVDIFVHDKFTNQTVRVSVSSNGTEANSISDNSTISDDGRFVAYISRASNLDPTDNDNEVDVFVHDRDTDMDGIFDEPGEISTTRVSVSPDGSQTSSSDFAPSLSGDGKLIAFSTAYLYEGQVCAIWVYNLQTSQKICASVGFDGEPAYGSYENPILSANGEFVVYSSSASNLVPDDTNMKYDIFLFNLSDGEIKRVSISSFGEQSNGDSMKPSVSSDGRYIAFESIANNLVSGDTYGNWDVFIHDSKTNTTKRVSVSPSGEEAFGHSGEPSLSGDGKFVAFTSTAANIVETGDDNQKNDVFLHNQLTGENYLLSVAVDDTSGNGDSNIYGSGDAIAFDGRTVAFVSNANDLVLNDTNSNYDVFVREISIQYTVFLPIIIR
jgi:Tol biopolymer transport system component